MEYSNVAGLDNFMNEIAEMSCELFGGDLISGSFCRLAQRSPEQRRNDKQRGH